MDDAFAQKVHDDPVRAMLVTKLGDRLVTASCDSSVAVFGIKEKKLMKRFKNVCASWIKTMILLSHDTRACVASFDGEMKILSLDTGDVIFNFQTSSEGINCIILSHDKKFIISADAKTGHVRKWNVSNYDLRGECEFDMPIGRMVEM